MFIRIRGKPRVLQEFDTLTQRLPNEHPRMPQIKRQAAQTQRGLNGERRLDYYLRVYLKSLAY